FLPAYAGQKFLPPGIPLGTKLSAEPRTRPCGLAHSQRSISLYVSRPSAHVGWTGLFCQSGGIVSALLGGALGHSGHQAAGPQRMTVGEPDLKRLERRMADHKLLGPDM